MKALTKRALAAFGFRLQRVPSTGLRGTQWPTEALAPLAAPNTVIDVGVGYGTPDLYAAFPDSFLILIEPLTEFEEPIRSILEHRTGAVEWTGLGATEGEEWISVAERPTQSSFHDRTALTAKRVVDARRVPITTLDALIEKLNPPRPFVVKIDTEGSELDVIRGGRTTLESTEAIIVEASVAERFEGGYRFRELAGEIFSLGFDLVDVMSVRRTRDGRLNYLDAVFVRAP